MRDGLPVTFSGVREQQSQKPDQNTENDQYCSFHICTIDGPATSHIACV
jgi:hypothetical protein